MEELSVVLLNNNLSSEWESAVDVLASMVAVGYALKDKAKGAGIEPVNDAIDQVQNQLDDLRNLIMEEAEIFHVE